MEIRFGSHTLVIFDDQDKLSKAAAEFVCQHSKTLLLQNDNYYLSLAGGSTPKRLYELLASDDYSTRLAWQKIELFFGDERYVSPTHPDSNYRMVREVLLDRISLSAEQINAIPTDCEVMADCAERYHQILATLPAVNNIPAFDLILLGMGTDGHTASLFPGTDVLNERNSFAATVYVEKLDSWRISLTYPVLNVARQLLVLVSGESKAEVLEDIMVNRNTHYPVAQIDNPHGMLWYVDRAAARRIIN